MSSYLSDADTWRMVAAAFSVVVLFALTVGIVARAATVPNAWRIVLWAVVGQQGANTYLHVSRTYRDDFPDRVDLPLVGIVTSLLLLLIAVVGTFVVDEVERRGDDDGS